MNTDPFSRVQSFLSAAAVVFDPAQPETAEKVQLRGAVEQILLAARELPHVAMHAVDLLVTSAHGDPWSEQSSSLALLVLTAIPEDRYWEALVRAGIESAPEPVPLHPKFIEAGEALAKIQIEHGEEAAHAPEHAHLIDQFAAYQPDRPQGLRDFFGEGPTALVLH